MTGQRPWTQIPVRSPSTVSSPLLRAAAGPILLDVRPATAFRAEPALIPGTRWRDPEATGAVPFDVPEVRFGHVAERCSFDAFVETFVIRDPALAALSRIVRGADTSRLELAPEPSGLLAVSRGLSALFAENHEMLRHGLVVYDLLYALYRAGVS